MKRYYTLEDLKDDPNDRLGDSRLVELCRLAEDRGVKVSTIMTDCRDYLAKIGVLLLNRQHSLECFDYASSDAETINAIELEIKTYAQRLSIAIHDVRACLDYDKIIPEAFKGMQIVLEDIIVPSDKASYEARVERYIDELHSDGKTLILTDPYLFKPAEADYINELENFLRRSKAAKIACYMQKSNRNSTYQLLSSRLSASVMEFHEYNDCHDRFWLCPEEHSGFCMGTSLNGLGRKICRIDILDITEVDELLAELK